MALAEQLNLNDSSTDLSQIRSNTDNRRGQLLVGGNKNKNGLV